MLEFLSGTGAGLAAILAITAVISTLGPSTLSRVLVRLLRRVRDQRDDLGAELRESADRRVAALNRALEEPEQAAWGDLEKSAFRAVAVTVESSSRDTNLYTRYADEAVFRSKVSYWIALSIGILGVLVIMSAVVLTTTAGLEPGIAAGIAGTLQTSIGALLYRRADAADKRAGEWFEKASANLDKSDQFQRTLDISHLVTDHRLKDHMLALAGVRQLFPEESAVNLSHALGRSSTKNVDKNDSDT